LKKSLKTVWPICLRLTPPGLLTPS
jgi:hypothetical protein